MKLQHARRLSEAAKEERRGREEARGLMLASERFRERKPSSRLTRRDGGAGGGGRKERESTAARERGERSGTAVIKRQGGKIGARTHG
jgi:hypothetical protein